MTQLFLGSMIFSESRRPLFGIMLQAAGFKMFRRVSAAIAIALAFSFAGTVYKNELAA